VPPATSVGFAVNSATYKLAGPVPAAADAPVIPIACARKNQSINLFSATSVHAAMLFAPLIYYGIEYYPKLASCTVNVKVKIVLTDFAFVAPSGLPP
jgi:hypothetical protein